MSPPYLDGINIIGKSHPIVRQMTFGGIRINIETDKGQERHWDDPDTKEHGTTLFKVPYGYIVGTQGSEKNSTERYSAVDVFVGPNEDSDKVFIVNQMKRPEFKEHDEVKVLLGFNSAEEAKKMYLAHYNNPKFFGSMDEQSLDDFKNKYNIRKSGSDRKIDFNGVAINISTEKGEYRQTDHGLVKMQYPYGYIINTESKGDKSELDIYVGPDDKADTVYVIHQMKPPHFTEWDEDKYFFGFESSRQAKNAYLRHYDDARYFGSIISLPIDTFKNKFLKKAFSDISTVPNQTSSPTPTGVPVGQKMMIPPLPGIDDPGGAEFYLSKMGSAKDKDLTQLASDIWGTGYDYRGATPESIRAELIGFLLDHKNYQTAQLGPQTTQQPSINGQPGSLPSSSSSTTSESNVESAGNPSASTTLPKLDQVVQQLTTS